MSDLSQQCKAKETVEVSGALCPFCGEDMMGGTYISESSYIDRNDSATICDCQLHPQGNDVITRRSIPAAIQTLEAAGYVVSKKHKRFWCIQCEQSYDKGAGGKCLVCGGILQYSKQDGGG